MLVFDIINQINLLNTFLKVNISRLFLELKNYFIRYQSIKKYLVQVENKYVNFEKDVVAEWSKAVDSGSIPKGRGFESRPHHFFILFFY